MAENKNENQQSQTMMDKTYVVEGFDPSKLQNADVNLSQYWDDSSEANYNNPSLWGWENTKYTGENTLGSQVAYNPNATIEWLNPDYKYWQEAQMQNSQEANYIAKRNDEIASALYNAWKTSIQDVANFLDSQKGYYNSVWNERANTVTAVWKRIGQIAEQNKKDEKQPEATPEQDDSAIENMQSDLNKSTGGKIYGKVTAEEWNPKSWIDTLEDENSVYRTMTQSRINAFKELQSMSDETIAAALISGEMSSDSQSMRDLMQYDPSKYESVKLAEKQIRWQMNINAITSWDGDYVTSATNGKSGLNNDIADFANNNSTSLTSVASILSDVNTTLSSNQSFNSASESMDALESDMATLQNRIKNLKKEASQVFKWDAPDYLVKAYIANRTAEIQDQLSILETRYNYAQTRANQEWSRTMDIMNYNLKKEELDIKKQSAALEEYATKQWLMIDWYKATNWEYMTSDTLAWGTVQTTTISREEIWTTIDGLVQACADWKLWNAQCAAGIQKYYLPYLWVDLWTLSKRSEKQWICNEDTTYSPRKWDLVVMSSKSKPENWHIWIVVWFDGSDMVYLDWNWELWDDWKWTEQPWLHKISLDNSKIYGYYNPTKGAAQAKEETTWTDRFGRTYDFSTYAGWNKLSTEEKEMVKWILAYQVDPNKLAKSGTENWKANTRMRAAAIALGGEAYDEANYEQNFNLVKKWNNSTQAGWELSRNATAADELMRLYNIYHKYDGVHTSLTPLNRWTSSISKLEGFAAVEEFNAALQVAASELAWALKGNASPSEPELKEYKDALSFNLSPSQFDAKVAEYVHGINNKMASEAQYYEKLTGVKPYNIYNEKEWLPQFVNDIAWIDLSKYFSDVDPLVKQSTPSTKRTEKTTTWWNTSRTNTNGGGLSAEEKAKSMQWF